MLHCCCPRTWYSRFGAEGRKQQFNLYCFLPNVPCALAPPCVATRAQLPEMRSIGLMHSHHGAVGFQTGMRFQAIAFPSPLRAHTPLSHGGGRSAPPLSPAAAAAGAPLTPTRRHRRRRHCPHFSSLFDSAEDAGGDDDEDEASGGARQGAPPPSDGKAGNPLEPRADERISDRAAAPGPESSAEAGGGAAAPEEAGGEEEQIDWDKAWASTRQRMEQEKEKEKEKKAAPAFSGRKQVVAKKNTEGGYDFEEIAADGSSRMRGEAGSGGFGFADSSSQMEDGPGRVRRQEQEAVNLATTNQVRAYYLGISTYMVGRRFGQRATSLPTSFEGSQSSGKKGWALP